jgi:hypothetical protein
MPITLPPDAAPVEQGERRKIGSEEPNPTILQRIQEGPNALARVVNRASPQVEFPEFPEITEMAGDQAGFFERLIPSAKMLMTRDDMGKAEIIQRTFGDDPRFGGAFVDRYNNPMVMWNGIPYYVNKPGISDTDLGQFIGEVAKYLPATKFVGGAKTKAAQAGRGAVAYTATEAAGETGEAIVTPETRAAKAKSPEEMAEEIGVSTAIGVATDVAIPPALRGLQAGATAVSKPVGALFPRIGEEALSQSKYPLTVGQRTALPPQGVTPRVTGQLRDENNLRYAAGESLGTDIIRGFDERQLDQIRADARALQEEFGAGLPGLEPNYGMVPLTAAETVQERVSGAAGRMKEESSRLYQAVREAPRQPSMTPQGVQVTAGNLLEVLAEMRITPRQLEQMPALRNEVTQLRRLQRRSRDPKFRSQSLDALHGYQKSLSVSVGNASPGSPEQRALLEMKNRLDNAIYEGIERGLITGDQEVLDQLQNAAGAYRDYMGLVGRGPAKNQAERTSNKILEQLSSKDYTPLQVANLLFGHSMFAPSQSVPVALDKLKTILPPEEYGEVVALLKDGILAKAFAGKQGEITRTAIVKNFTEVFRKQKAIIESLFSPEEIRRIESFRENVLPTLWAEINQNPSGSAYTMLSALSRRGLLSVPYVGPKVEGVLREAGQVSDALNATRQFLDRGALPLLSSGAQAVMRESLSKSADDLLPEIEMTDAEREAALMRLQEIEQRGSEIPLLRFFQPEAGPVLEAAPGGMEVQRLMREQPQAMAPMPPGFNPAMSPTILPNPEDRELAARLQGGILGLG